MRTGDCTSSLLLDTPTQTTATGTAAAGGSDRCCFSSSAAVGPSPPQVEMSSSSSSSRIRMARGGGSRMPNFARAWTDFQHALLRCRDPFNPYVWIGRLVAAFCADVGTAFRWNRLLHPWHRRCVPLLAVSLVLAVVASYCTKLRTGLVRPRWCPSAAAAADDESSSSSSTGCAWLYLHDALVGYLTVMILFHFLGAATSSPGVWSTSSSNQRWNWDTAENDRLRALYCGQCVDGDDDDGPPPPRQDPALDCDDDNSQQAHPPPPPNPRAAATRSCTKCNPTILRHRRRRPPRCHHCRTCSACVLQFDHHCVWLDNCVGYGNVRSFVLSVAYIAAGCWYGVLLLYHPFYDPILHQLRLHGGLIPYIRLYTTNHSLIEEGTVPLFHVPTGSEMMQVLFFGDSVLPVQVVVEVVFPLLLGVGAILALFLGTHVKYILTAQTSLEHKIILDGKIQSLLSNLSPPPTKVPVGERKAPDDDTGKNPFDQGWYRNWCRIMGPNPVLLLVPVPFQPPPPYVPPFSLGPKKFQ
jgi:DHHC palmitoyltransferase